MDKTKRCKHAGMTTHQKNLKIPQVAVLFLAISSKSMDILAALKYHFNGICFDVAA